MIRILAFSCFLVISTLVCSAQIRVIGRVTDSQSGKPLAKVIVSARDKDNKTKSFVQTKADGTYMLTATSNPATLHFSIIGYKKKTIPFVSGQTEYHVTLVQSAIELREVKIKSQKIRQRGDTLVYSVASFAKDGDRSIGDVLKKMPGIQVAEDGKVSYNGMPINKFYIEGKDLLQGKYGLATKGVEHKDVSSVEVMTNHQPVKALKNLSESEQAAINLKLKDGSKSHLITTINAALGTPELWNGNLTTMMFNKQWQMISTYKTNNTGEDLQRDIREHIDILDRKSQTYSETDYLALPAGKQSELEQQRTLFNKTHLLSTNWIFGIGRDATLDAQVSYLTDRQHHEYESKTEYFQSAGSRMIEDRLHSMAGIERLAAKMTIEVNRDSDYLNNVLRTDLGWDGGDVLTGGTYDATQHLYLPRHQLSNSLEYIHRKGKNALTVNSQNQWTWLPQYTLVVREGANYRQALRRHAFYSDEHVNYDLGVGAFVVAMEGGINYLDRSLNDDRSRRYQAYLTPTLKYPHRHFNFTLRLPLSYYHYDFGDSKRDDLNYGSSLGVSYRGIQNLSLSLTGGISQNPYNISNHFGGQLMTNYRTMTRGTTEYGTATGKSVALSAFYQNSSNGVFGFLTATRMWNKNPFVSIQSFDGDWLINGLMLCPNHSSSWLVNGNIETMLPFMGGMFKLYVNWLQHDREMFTGEVLTAYRNNLLSLDAIINGTLFKKLNWKYELEYGNSRLRMGNEAANSLQSFEHSFSLYYSPVKKLLLSFVGEYYHNEIVRHQYTDHLLLDAKAIWKLRSNFELTFTLKNMLNVDHYAYTTYTQLMKYSLSQPIRGRELLVSIYFRP
ncbi:carboxypeptidase regulatory-like domain-containing protein [Prevotella sp. P6B1]|uniref:carboxypeptidase regulatory-like domain-containing protein n=1 Tax=Prevotella sp. P6B1 TaxID=1410613 RepID=UPI0018CC7B27|nr:carboxypeptidase regulatory-like domain-containing protein [Prevotella sp. P6B1]